MPITMMSVARGVGAWFWPSLWAKAVLDVRSAAARVLVESRNLDMTIPVLVERPPPGRRTARTGLRGSFDAGWSVCIGKCGRLFQPSCTHTSDEPSDPARTPSGRPGGAAARRVGNEGGRTGQLR